MINTIITYIQQRFHLLQYTALSIFTVLLARGQFFLTSEDLVIFPFLLVMFFLFRLYDDLASRITDKDKPNRIYTIPQEAQKLWKVLIIFWIMLFGGSLFFHYLPGIALAVFFLINHIIYFILYNKANWKHYLPLIKYPVIVFAITPFNPNQAWYTSLVFLITIFLAFIVFEVLNDSHFPLKRWYALMVAPLTILLVKQVPLNLYIIGIIICSIAICYWKNKSAAYLFLLLFLMARIIY